MSGTDDFVRYCCGDPDCPNDCEREQPPVNADRLPGPTDFAELRAWVAEHLNAIDLEDVDGDVAQVLSSLYYIVHGRIGCTERSDYTEAQWRVLLLCKEREPTPVSAAAVSPAEPPEATTTERSTAMYDVAQVRDLLIEAAQGKRPDDDWLRAVEGASAIDREPGTFGLSVAGQEFFVSVEAA